MPSMEKNLKDWCEQYEIEEAELKEVEEVSFQKKTFADNTIKKDDWKHLGEKAPSLIAFAVADCGIEKIEAIPDPDKNELEVLDLSENPITSLDFISSVQRLVSLTLKNCSKIDSLKKLEPLKEHPSLKVIEFSEDMLMGEKNEEDLRKKIFEMLPNLMAVNGMDAEGQPIQEEEEDYDLDDLGDLEGLTDEQMQALLAGGDDDDDEEEDDDDDDDDAAEEPSAKKQKTS